MKFCILASAFCILTSFGLGLDIRVDTILAPSGSIDSGQAIIPRMVISNMSNEPADSVSAYFTIDDGTPSGYSDSLTGLNMPALTTETLAFGGWVPRGRDSMTAIAWIHCDGDTYPQNDTFRLRFFVRVRKYSMTLYEPGRNDTLRVGDTIVFKVMVWNYGNTEDSGYVRFRVGPSFVSTSDTVLLGGILEARDTFIVVPGIFGLQCSLFVLPEDSCAAIIVDTFFIRGEITVDVDARAVLAPTDVIDTTMVITPSGCFGNLGTADASFEAFFCIRDPDGTEIYAESSWAVLMPGDSTDLQFTAVRFSIPGNYTAICSTAMPGDQNSTNDVVYKTFRVVPSQAVEESPKPQAPSSKPQPTVMPVLPAGAVAFDAMGRRVVSAKPGVYFVMEQSAYGSQYSGMENGARRTVHVRKVILQR